ncbi:hypothetical protein OV450_7350 [Actinobacteria bacterium OV450]|nr:hypothetical protein OV450_7350 [Actinobacteria bacterium OV450]
MLLLAGTDPDELGAAGLIQRAEYLRLLALGCTPSLAAQILFDGAGKACHWRQEDPVFARACDAVKELGAGRPAPARAPRFTPERRCVFLERLESGLSVTAAAAAVGVTVAVLYQRRKRDPAFAAAMDAAHHAHPRTPHQEPRTGKRSSALCVPVSRCARPLLPPGSGPKPSTTAAAPTGRSPTAPTNSEPPR